MSTTNKFGPIVTGIDLARAVRDTVLMWQGDYLAEVGELSGRTRDALPGFRSYVLAAEEDRFVDDQLPSCLIVVPTSAVTYKSRNTHRVAWDVRLGAVVKGQDRDNSLELGMLYVAALRSLVLQHPSLGGFALGVTWEGERYDTIDLDGDRTLGMGAALFTVEAEMVIDSHHGPTTPSVNPSLPPGSWGLVEQSNIFISVKPEET